MRNFAPLFSDC